MTGLPGLRRGDHVGLVVPDLEVALTFFTEVLGGRCLVRHGPYRGGPDDPDLQVRQFARHPRTEVEGIAMVQLADLVVELLEFSAPDQRQDAPRTSDLGGHHLALYVDDLPAAAEHLRANGVRVLGEPMPLPGPESGDGALFVFALTDWGLALELVTYPNGKAWQQAEIRAAVPAAQLSTDPRIPYPAELSPQAQGHMAEARSLGTPNPDVFRIFDHHPELMRSFAEHWRVIFDDGVADRALKELARRRIANAIACVTCTSVGVEAGSIEEKLAESYTWRSSTVLDGREKAVLWLLDVLLGWDDDVDGAYREMNAHFSPAEVVELGWFMAFNAGTIPFVRSWRLHAEPAP